MARLTALLLLMILALAGCETLVGARKDLHAVGHVLQETAHEVNASLKQ
ncbi:hypothetical protein JCM30471_29780 [Desulfuromonas carbonis]